MYAWLIIFIYFKWIIILIFFDKFFIKELNPFSFVSWCDNIANIFVLLLFLMFVFRNYYMLRRTFDHINFNRVFRMIEYVVNVLFLLLYVFYNWNLCNFVKMYSYEFENRMFFFQNFLSFEYQFDFFFRINESCICRYNMRFN